MKENRENTPEPELLKNEVVQLIGGEPQILFLMSGGIAPVVDKEGNVKRLRATTIFDGDFADGNAYGYLGGVYRMLAAAEMAKLFPNAPIITNSIDNQTKTSHAKVYAKQLEKHGVDPKRITLQEKSRSTRDEFKEMVMMAVDNDWKGPIAMVTNDYHIERSVVTFVKLGTLLGNYDPEFRQILNEFYARDIKVLFVSAEKVLGIVNPKYKDFFGKLKTREPFAGNIALREKMEASGVKALQDNTYTKRF